MITNLNISKIKAMLDENKRKLDENKRILDENKRMLDENQRMLDENKREFERMLNENQRMLDENKRMLDENKRMLDERILNENQRILNINEIDIIHFPQNNSYSKIYDDLEEIELNEKSIDNFVNDKCLICLEKYLNNNKICYLPCFHFFHSNCIKSWIKIKRKCPLCNNII